MAEECEGNITINVLFSGMRGVGEGCGDGLTAGNCVV
jgi:hypothetical protein